MQHLVPVSRAQLSVPVLGGAVVGPLLGYLADRGGLLQRDGGGGIIRRGQGTEGTVRVARRAGAQVVELGENLGALARNVGLRETGTPFVAFADDDSWWAPGRPCVNRGPLYCGKR